MTPNRASVRRMRVRPMTIAHLAIGVAATGLSPGCSKHSETPKVVPLSGTVEKIDRNSDGTGELTVVYYSEKHKQEIAGTAKITKDTEIMIDGAVASLADIREGEQIRGEIRIDGKGDAKINTVLKILIDRPKTESGTGG